MKTLRTILRFFALFSFGLGMTLQSRTALFSRQQPGGVFSIQDMLEHPGDIYFVDSTAAGAGDTTGHGKSPDSPFATLDYAVGQCTASKGDVIYVMPGHVETVVGANGLDFDVAGIKVVGLGRGADRATINLTTAVAASIRINANSVHLENLLITGGIDNITNVLTINGKTDVVLEDIEYRDVTGQCALFLLASNNSDRLTIRRLRYIGDTANAGTTEALSLDGCDDLLVEDCILDCNATTAVINFVTTATNRATIRRCRIRNWNSADVCIKDTITGSTGGMGPDLFLSLTDNAANITEAITGATFRVFDNVYVVNADNEKAMLINWTASTDA